VEIDVDDEPGSLLDSLNALREKVAMWELPVIPGLSHPKAQATRLLTSQLDRELISHNMIVAEEGGWHPSKGS